MIHPHQIVVKADGSSVLAEQIVVGDEVQCSSGQSTVLKIGRVPTKEWVEVFFHGGRSLLVSSDHRFADEALVLEDGIRAGDLTIETALAALMGPLRIDGIVRIQAPAKAVVLEVSPFLYYLNGVRSHSDEVA